MRATANLVGPAAVSAGVTTGQVRRRWVGRGVFLAATGAAVIGGFAVQNKVPIPLTVAVALVVAAVWACAGFVTWDGSSLPIPAVGALAGAIGLAASRLDGSNHRLGSSIATGAGCLLIALSLHWLLSLPTGRVSGLDAFRSRVVVAGYTIGVGGGAALIATDRPLSVPVAAIAFGIVAVATGVLLLSRYKEATSGDRDRLRWLAAGVVAATDLAVVVGVLHLVVDWPAPVGAATLATVGVVPLALVASRGPATATSGGRALVNVMSLAGFSLVMSLIYLVVVLGLGHTPDGSGDRETLALSIVAASIAAVAYVPARERLLQWATRAVYGSRQAPDEVVRTFGSRLTRAIPMDELLLQLAESLTKTMGLSSAAIYTGAGEVLECAVSVPDQGPGPRSLVVSQRERPVVTRASVSGNAWVSVWLPGLLDRGTSGQVRVAPIRNAGELLGLLVVERPATADPFSEDDDRVLADLAREVGLAFHNTQLDAALQTTLAELRDQAVELRESRARIVASGDAERRRVERNLHDGAQQNLVALAVSLRLAKDMVEGDSKALAEMLDAMVDEVQNTIQELRDLAHGIYPPLLVDSGLVAALSAAASRSPLDVMVDAPNVRRFPPEVEAAVYFCCLEALQNASKHAPDAHVEVKVWEESGGLLFTVTDDGPGFDPGKISKGHGLVNMSDRLGAIGGSVRWESEPGHGARVWGSVPLA